VSVPHGIFFDPSPSSIRVGLIVLNIWVFLNSRGLSKLRCANRDGIFLECEFKPNLTSIVKLYDKCCL